MNQRTHTCGELKKNHVGQEVALCGWVSKRRDHGGVIFVDLRDRFGITQIVFDPAISESAHSAAHVLRSEFVLWCKGKVRPRPEGMANDKMTTGAIEVAIHDLVIFSHAKTPPFPLDEDTEVSEQVRLKYRYLDLRRPSLQKNLITRHQMLAAVRDFLNANSFVEVETPILYKSTPEGARDFIVPSRINPGLFYALPQSPQTLKQLLMISGLDRYYQIARCFRDEDLRADRQPEFSQVDIEFSFLDEETFFPMIEGMIKSVWKRVLGQDISTPFSRMRYSEAMSRFGSDKPDVRFGLELQDVSDIFKNSQFNVFKSALEPGSRGRRGSVRMIHVPGKGAEFSRKDLDDLAKLTAAHGAKGLLWIKIQDNGEMQSPAVKFFSESEKKNLTDCLNLKNGDLVLCIADQKNKVVFDALGALRLAVAKKIGLMEQAEKRGPAFLWITGFPLLEYNDQDKRYFALHHPFTRPAVQHTDAFLKGDNLEDVEACAYDLVLNGVEIGGGSLRIYRSDVQDAMFKALGMTAQEARDQFGFFLEALEYGTPPHGGIALGVDRLAAILCGVGPIRDVMAFPKTQKGTCLMSDSPSHVKPEQLTEVGVSLLKRQD